MSFCIWDMTITGCGKDNDIGEKNVLDVGDWSLILPSLSSLQMDYRSLVHDKDDAIYNEIKVIVLDIRGFYVSHSPHFTWNIIKILQ